MGSEVSDTRVRAVDRGLAHDLRNLLTAIDGHAQLVRAALDTDHPAHRDVDEVLAASSRARALTEAWLDGRAATPPEVPEPLDSLVRAFLPLLSGLMGDRVHVELRLAAPRPTRMGRLGLERVLLNLCLNARHAMPDGGTITILTDTRRSDGRLEVAVIDTGPGIDPAIVERLFDPDGPSLPPTGGHGLGLPTSLALLRDAGGTLEVESRAGSGTTMRVIVPGV